MFDTLFNKNKATGGDGASQSEMQFILSALDRSQAVIHFTKDGTILSANDNFLNAMGYSLHEIKGKHHSMFVMPDYKNSSEYKEFWAKLGRGEFQAAEYKRLGKNGKEIWIQASYNPILDKNGRVVKIVKYATDITEQTLKAADYRGQIKAVNRVQAVIEFELDGTIRFANENFLGAVGYSLAEIQGQHHSMFAPGNYADTQEYKTFWRELAEGKFKAGQYKRVGKGGKEIWIEASYNPIFNPDGKPFKVVKYATDITETTLRNSDYSGQIEAIQKAQAVISFELDGTIIEANDNFLGAVGYRLDEIKGQHHRMFVERDYGASSEYKQFWEALGRGEYQTAEYKRVGKGGKEIWIQASYNPIFDPEGKPFKVVKYATDITDQILAREEAGRVGELVDQNLEKIMSAVQDATAQASSASSASQQTTQTVQSVAAATEEFQSSSQEIARSMEASRSDVSKASEEANNADQSAQQLTSAASSMSNIVEVIQDIAAQINLLALNATIESARAGEAGRGFAVVASEVKSLANQVASATAQISTEISGMQDISNNVVSRLESIKGAVVSVESSVTSVASAVEEQVATTREITTSMQSASIAVDDINTSLGSISQAVGNASTFAEEGTELYRSIRVN